jgi:hypothetical protein
MAESPLRRVLQHFRMSLRRQDEASLSDAHLLGQFIEKNDETAFAVLTRRHGSMVMGVCLRVTRNRQDAEDAFQATLPSFPNSRLGTPLLETPFRILALSVKGTRNRVLGVRSQTEIVWERD